MQFTIVMNGQCSGGSHVHLTVTSGQQVRQIAMNRSDLTVDFSDFAEVRDLLAHLLRSRIKQAGATTPAQMKTAIESAPFHI